MRIRFAALAAGLTALTFGVAAQAQNADDPDPDASTDASVDAAADAAADSAKDSAEDSGATSGTDSGEDGGKDSGTKSATKSGASNIEDRGTNHAHKPRRQSKPVVGLKDAKPAATSRLTRLRRRYDRTAHQKPKPLDFFGLPIVPIFYGDVQMDIMHDFNAMGLDPTGQFVNEFITSLIPTSGSEAARRTNRTGFSVNQTQIYAGFWVPTDLGKALAFTNINFEQNTSGPPIFDLYLAYAEVGGLRAGKAWSTFSNVPAIPDTLDYEGPNAIPEVQNVMLRFTAHLTDEWTAAGAAEAPNANITMPNGSTNGAPLNQYPDAIVRTTWSPGNSTIQLSGIYRRLGAIGTWKPAGTTQEESFRSAVNGWGVQFSGNLAFNTGFPKTGGWFGRVFGRDSLQYGAVYGQGIGAYVQDTMDIGLDAAPISDDSSRLKAIRMATGWAGLEHFWSKNARSTVTFGYVSTYKQPLRAADTYKSALYVSGNLIFTLLGALEVGAEYIYGNRVTQGDGKGHNSRLQLSTIWNFGI
jgi:hypothetical protein